MLLSRALDAWSHSRDYFSRAYLAPVSLVMYWFVFSPSPVSSTRFLLSSQRIFNQSLQHHRSCRPVASKAERFLSFYQLQNGTVEIHDPELEEQLSLSTADLRFADYLIHHVNEYTEKGEQEAGWFIAVKKKIFGNQICLHQPRTQGSLFFPPLSSHVRVCVCVWVISYARIRLLFLFPGGL